MSTTSAAGAVRPLLLGYIRAHLLMTETELADAKQDLADFAAAEGYTRLGTVYVERIDHVPAAFACLLDELEREDARAVVVPGLHHLAVVGVTPSLRDHLERRTGARC